MSIAEFAYNSSVNRIIIKSPHEIVYGFRPRQPIDLIPMVDQYRVSESASSFATHMHELHKVISDKIKQSNFDYKLRADVWRKFKTFDIGDHMMVRIHPERLSLGTVKKLHARSAEPFKILTKLNDNAYVIDLPEDIGINSIFNIEDLVEYKSPNFNPNNPLVDESTPELFSERPPLFSLSDISHNVTENIDKILDDEIISTRDGETRRYLVCWERESLAKDTWLNRSKLQQIDPDLLEYYESFFTPDSTESSSLPPEENEEDMALTCLKKRHDDVYQRSRHQPASS